MTKKDNLKDHVGNLHIYIIASLVLVFFGILFLSTAFKNVSSEYTFNEKVELDSIEKDFIIGTIKLTNHGPITVKTDINNLVGCVGTEDLYLRFSDSDSDSRYNYRGDVEISRKSTKDIKVYSSYYPRSYDKKNVTNYQVYVYELDENQNQYNFCLDADKSTAIANIKVIEKLN